jgi:hypothetical protein
VLRPEDLARVVPVSLLSGTSFRSRFSVQVRARSTYGEFVASLKPFLQQVDRAPWCNMAEQIDPGHMFSDRNIRIYLYPTSIKPGDFVV